MELYLYTIVLITLFIITYMVCKDNYYKNEYIEELKDELKREIEKKERFQELLTEDDDSKSRIIEELQAQLKSEKRISNKVSEEYFKLKSEVKNHSSYIYSNKTFK